VSPNRSRTTTTILLCTFAAGLFATARVVTTTSAVTGRPQVTLAEAGQFMGEWTLALKGADGPGTFGLSVGAKGEKVVGELTSETMPKQVITDVSMQKNSLTLSYTFTYEGMPVDAVISLTPADDGTMNAQIDFAGGAYVMGGTATKKDTSK